MSELFHTDGRDSPRINFNISIVIFQTEYQLFEKCLNDLATALQILTDYFPFYDLRVILVDNSPSLGFLPDYLELAELCLKDIRCSIELIHGHGNVGYGSGQNKSLETISTTEKGLTLFMNPDIFVDPKSLVMGADYLQKNTDVSAINPSAIFPGGSRQYLCKRYPSVIILLLRAVFPGMLPKKLKKKLDLYEMRSLSFTQPTKEVPLLSGCFLLCRTDDAKKVGGFDQRFFMYFEDFDFSIRLREAGALAFVPDMRVTHLGGNASKKGIRHIVFFLISATKFFARHGWRWY